MRNTNNLFGTDLIEQFQLWDMPMKCFLPKIQNLTANADNKRIRGTFSEVFSDGFSRCKKMSDKFELKPNIQPVSFKEM